MLLAAASVGLAVVSGTPPGSPGQHPLTQVAYRILAGKAGKQPPWKLPLVLHGLSKQPRAARCTTYCERCPDGGGTRTRWGTRLRRGIVAADPRWWGPGSVVYIGPPVDEVLIVEDTGGAVKGQYRFDVCVSGHHALCSSWGRFRAVCVPLYWTPPRVRWGCKPAGWQPPVWEVTPRLVEAAVAKAPVLRPLLSTVLASAPEVPEGADQPACGVAAAARVALTPGELDPRG
ncbi:MAG: 3D domain-containing protein [Armatimonadetes bacterium]|nr:3D domain-containing protein [Armatimonadota bacterium]